MIRLAKISDLPIIIKLVKPLYVTGVVNYWCQKDWLIPQIKYKRVWLECSGGHVRGLLIKEGDYIEILSVFKKYQNKKVGTTLVNHFKDIDYVCSLEDYDNIRFYEKLGFKAEYSYQYGKTKCIHLKRKLK